MRDSDFYAPKKVFISQIFGLKISKLSLNEKDELNKPKVDYKSISFGKTSVAVDNSKALVVYRHADSSSQSPKRHKYKKIKKLKVFVCFKLFVLFVVIFFNLKKNKITFLYFLAKNLEAKSENKRCKIPK